MATAVLLGEANAVAGSLESWLKLRNTLLTKRQRWWVELVPLFRNSEISCPVLDEELDAWAQWLSRQAEGKGEGSSKEYKSLLAKIEVAGNELKQLRRQFEMERQHASHLRQLQTEFLGIWAKDNPNVCPTCASDHSTADGITGVVRKVQTDVEEQLSSLEQKGKSTSEHLRKLETQLSALGFCPVSTSRQEEIARILAPLLDNQSLSACWIWCCERGTQGSDEKRSSDS
jgi:hypothetical protein